MVFHETLPFPAHGSLCGSPFQASASGLQHPRVVLELPAEEISGALLGFRTREFEE